MWQRLLADGFTFSPAIGAEPGSGYVHRGYKGGTFGSKVQGGVRQDAAVVVFFGSRDDMFTPPPELSSAVAATFGETKKVAPGATLIVVGPPWPTGEPDPAVLAVREVLRDETGRAGGIFVDPIEQRWLTDPHLLGADGIYPNDDGHKYLADKITNTVEKQLCMPRQSQFASAPPAPPPKVCSRLR
jgi:hypothetical protein